MATYRDAITDLEHRRDTLVTHLHRAARRQARTKDEKPRTMAAPVPPIKRPAGPYGRERLSPHSNGTVAAVGSTPSACDEGCRGQAVMRRSMGLRVVYMSQWAWAMSSGSIGDASSGVPGVPTIHAPMAT